MTNKVLNSDLANIVPNSKTSQHYKLKEMFTVEALDLDQVR